MDIMEQNVSTTNGIITFNMMAAMCHNNRGIGYQGDLPWPKLKADFEYYLKTTSTHKKDSSLMIVHVHGRKSWAGCTDFQASYGGVYHIVCSQSRDPSIKTHPNLLMVAGSVPEALEYIADLNRNGKLDSVWIMGGAGIYQECLSHPLCGRIYLTHVYKDFPSDTFFPPFDDDFREVKNDATSDTYHEEDGISFEFKVYQNIRKSNTSI
ncbi:dihydrofolate reductase-like isoform X10 [Dreissena polymorpha]|nr:dihydrofolate reductase-like isoform X3 [Dreissena polymorpha]XP_052264058.1 dihydrofolate reductase-like isoform X4 [Dreissena polymorpha]XP_052264060.1 dihydrofolate reductase-like isoform X6 [Dreissena polymorpha]XP_052264061.1 dihydrofolate reductase-like isoform X7 [Dreissena polymorpha]XP_052264062.1 dihydrofolate reductase-like isoform X8 [Dreissena polymorpha]XP_052264064.1 dihydrofolate reductase-like isoform X10 [Dreissena polymorpha]